MLHRFAPLALLVALVLPASAQPLPETNNTAFAPLDLPTPNPYRAANGAPGPAYWQNEADYRIEASLDTTDHRIEGTVTLTYTNHSPQALDHLWLHLEQNLFAPDSRGAALLPADSRWRGAFAEGGYDLGTVTVAQDGRRYEPATWVDDTRMRVALHQPLAANGGTLTLTIPYAFVSPEYGSDRMGRFEAARGTVYEFAQWFPRVAVFDDVNGWNAMPYLGQGEFYLDYGDFDVSLTLPASMTVVATGALQNETEVFTPAQQQRLARARTAAATVPIVAPDEVGTPESRPAMDGTLTWRFRAENVRDFAWAGSAAFILDGTGAAVEQLDGTTNDVLVLAAYPHEGLGTPEEPGWEEAALYGRYSILNNSVWYPYPYPVAISVGGIVGGMEYPMIQFTSAESRHMGLWGTLDHELGHNWFPMIVGSDERRHAWMDEGLNTFLNTVSGRVFYDEQRRPGQPGYGRADEVRMIRLTGDEATRDYFNEPYAADQALMTYPDQLRRESLGWLAYRKPAKGLQILRHVVLGEERFDDAFRAYIRRWAYKHPQPADLFRTIEDVAGEDLDWFWRGWFMTTDSFDVAVASVEAGEAGTTITVENRGGLVFPVPVAVTYDDGRAETLRLPVEAFFLSDTATLGAGPDVRSVTLDPDRLLPDMDRSNDAWTR